ncbi:MAG: NAD(P)-dependent oxidoreductase [Holosporales bacterium]|jgi:glutamate synthase (NADPH/NADH) small chain
MAENLLQFARRPAVTPEKRLANLRRADFREIYEEFQPQRAIEQAGRCSQCGIPFCQIHCPLGNNIPDWLMLTAGGRLEEAYQVAAATNTFPEICGRICPQDKLCEGNCVVEKDFGAITIGAVERYITDTAWENGWVAPLRPLKNIDFSVGIVGSGPAGLAAAERLRRAGASVTVYERADAPGGLLLYGIPNFKLDKTIVRRRTDWLADGGIDFVLNRAIDENGLAQLRQRHDAVLLAGGVYQPRTLAAPGQNLSGVVAALPYLMASNRGEVGELHAGGKRVVVVGGGDTAMDCVRTAVRQGAPSVTCVYRRDRASMPGSAREVYHAEEEGVTFVWNTQPLGFIGTDKVEAVQTDKEPLAADMVVLALGFVAEDFTSTGLVLASAGTIKVNERFETSLPGVYAAGDVVRGASLVVWAIRDGREAAAAMLQHSR